MYVLKLTLRCRKVIKEEVESESVRMVTPEGGYFYVYPEGKKKLPYAKPLQKAPTVAAHRRSNFAAIVAAAK